MPETARATRVIRCLNRCGCAGLLVLLFTAPAAADVRQVVLLQSYDRGTLVLDRFTEQFRIKVDEAAGEPVTFTQFVVTPAGFDTVPEQAIVGYLHAAFEGRPRPDLVVTVGGPAAAFARKYRGQLFPGTPLLFAAVDRRFVGAALGTNEMAVVVDQVPAKVIENILRALPDTTSLFVVTGSGGLGRFWKQQFEAGSQGVGDRIKFLWTDHLSYADMVRQAATLPPRSAIFFVTFDVDAQGATYSSGRVLADLHARANAPLFGNQSSELGGGIVGGSLVPVDALARSAADVTLRILQGASPDRIGVRTEALGNPTFDWRELRRWGIPESRLPAGSVVLFREPGVWERSKWLIIASATALLAQTLLITALLANRIKRQKAEQSLRESEERFRVLADAAPVMIRMSSADGLSADFNAPWLRFTGRSLQDELKNGWLDGIHADDVAACVQTYQRAFERRGPYRMEYRLRRLDGEYRWVLESGEPRLTPNGSFAGHIGSAIDITDLKAARATLSNLNRRLIQAQEQERSRVARELHDDVCQRMTVLALDLQRLGDRLPEGAGDVRRHVLSLYDDITALGRDVNSISHRLHSSKLEVLGLAAAARALCAELSTLHGVTVEFVQTDVPTELREGIAINLFRVLQEALSNAVKYSGASRCGVSLARAGDDLTLEVVDRGCGFDLAAAMATSGLGLVSMQERLRLLDGELVIESKPGTGTTIRAAVPLSPAAAARPSAPYVGAWT